MPTCLKNGEKLRKRESSNSQHFPLPQGLPPSPVCGVYSDVLLPESCLRAPAVTPSSRGCRLSSHASGGAACGAVNVGESIINQHPCACTGASPRSVPSALGTYILCRIPPYVPSQYCISPYPAPLANVDYPLSHTLLNGGDSEMMCLDGGRSLKRHMLAACTAERGISGAVRAGKGPRTRLFDDLEKAGRILPCLASSPPTRGGLRVEGLSMLPHRKTGVALEEGGRFEPFNYLTGFE